MIIRILILILFSFTYLNGYAEASAEINSGGKLSLSTQQTGGQFLKTYTVVEKDMKKGLLNEKGELIIPAIYDDLGWTKGTFTVINEVLGYKQNNNWGLLALNNKKITESVYADIYPYKGDLFIAARRSGIISGNIYGVINSKGKCLVPFKYLSITGNGNILIASIKRNNHKYFGLINAKEQVLLSFNYGRIYPLAENLFAVKGENQKFALFDFNSKSQPVYQYDSISAYKGELAIVVKEGRQGVIDKGGKVLLEPAFKKVEINENASVSLLSFQEWTFLNGNNQPIKSFFYDAIEPVGKNAYKVKISGYEAIVDASNNMLTPALHYKIDTFHNNIAFLRHRKKLGLINNTGKILLEPSFDFIELKEDLIITRNDVPGADGYSVYKSSGEKINYSDYQEIKNVSEGFVAVKRKNSWGFINSNGAEVISCRYDSVGRFIDGVAPAYLGLCGLINTKGEWLVKPMYADLREVKRNLYIYRQGSEYGLVSSNGTKLYSTSNKLEKINYGILEFNPNGQAGLINDQGRKILATEYDAISPLLEDNIYIFQKNDKTGIINKEGKILVNLENNFQELHDIHESFLGVRIDNKYGFVDINGKLRIANRYDSIGYFKNGFAPVKLMGNWGFVDKIERLVVQPYYEEITAFENGISIAKKNGKYGLINPKGVVLQNFDYESLELLPSGRFLCRKNGKFGLLDEKGKVVVLPKYNYLKDPGNGFVLIKKDEKFGLLTLEGVSTIPLIYDWLKYDDINNHYIVTKPAEWKTVNLITPTVHN